MEEPKLLDGGLAVDDRGRLTFVNSFDFRGVRRFYQVSNHDVNVVRAFHGHRRETKWVYVARGCALVVAVPLDDLLEGKAKPRVHRHVLSSLSPRVLCIPPDYANGFRSLDPSSEILFFSDRTLEESKADDIRFPFDACGAGVWLVENR